MVVKGTISPALKFGLRFIGVWPGVQYTVAKQLIFMSVSLGVQYYQYLNLIRQIKVGEIQNFVDSFPVTIYYSLVTINMVIFWTNRRLVCEMLDCMDADWRECEKIEKHLQLMTTPANIFHLFSDIMFTFNTFSGGVYLLSDNTIAILHLMKGDNKTSTAFPIKIQFPFEAEQSPIYELIVVILFLHGMTITITITVFTVLIFAVVLHVSGQIDIMCEELKMISEELSYQSSGHSIRMLVEKHHKIIAFSGNIDKLFSYMTLTQIFLDTVVICALGLFLVASTDESMAVQLKIVLVYFTVTIKMFIYCFAGEYLSIKSKLIADTVYDILWYNTSSKYGKDILFVIIRCQKQLTMKAGGMKELTIETFASVMKASASYVSVLHAMY